MIWRRTIKSLIWDTVIFGYSIWKCAVECRFPHYGQNWKNAKGMAGLFALWASYQTEKFEGIVAASPSVWFPKWIEYATDNKPFAKSIYLSLGDKEEKTKNPVMAQVGNAIRKLNELLAEQIGNTILEWNPGNHFIDSEKRTAKGFAWVMNK